MKNGRAVLLTLLTVLFIFVLVSPIVSPNNPFIASSDPTIRWNDAFAFQQEIILPIDTVSSKAIFQPIDIPIKFTKKCWAFNVTIHSIRVCCWNNNKWSELESQIYNLNFTTENIISNCNLIFLIPSDATGKEKYYLYYNDEEIGSPHYDDHVDIKDVFYYYEPITGIAVEGDFYELSDDEDIVYGIGQKGKVMNRKLSQIAIRMKPGTKKLDILNTDLLTSFSFSYQNGPDDNDEVSSDQKLTGKEITINGNLMIEFVINSESTNGIIQTSNVYRYYHSPTDDKRINVHVKHQILEDIILGEDENNDGRFGTIISYHSKSESMKKMQFGDILPYLHVYGEDGRIKEYNVIINPENSQREWVISYDDDCDIGSSAWFSYSQGYEGKTHGVIFSSNEQIISNASDERDGVQLKISEKEYLDIIGAEIDYASIIFGRNSYELLQPHDVLIDKGLIIEFDVEFISLSQGTYEDIHEESKFFQKLVDFRNVFTNQTIGKENIYTLTVMPHLGGKIGSFPLLANITKLPLPVLIGELYRDKELITSGVVDKPLGFQIIKFSKLSEGEYTIKIFRKYGNITKKFVGVSSVDLTEDKTVHIYCTWEKNIEVHVHDQYDHLLGNVTVLILQDSLIVSEFETNRTSIASVQVPFNVLESYESNKLRNITLHEIFNVAPLYHIKAYYKGFQVFDESLKRFDSNIAFSVPVYNLLVHASDELNLAPDVNINPFLVSTDMKKPIEIYPASLDKGTFYFENIPSANYTLHISYGGYSKSKSIQVPSCGEEIQIRFAYLADLSFDLLSIRGEIYDDESLDLVIKRMDTIIFEKIKSDDSVEIPPGTYTINVYDKDHLIGSKSIKFSHDATASIVTSRSSLIGWMVILTAFFIIIPCLLLTVLKKVSLNTCLKLFVLGLVLISLVQPWWSFYASAENDAYEKTSNMYIFPQIMIEEFHENDFRFLSIATIPEIFTDFLFLLLTIILIGILLMLLSFLPNIILKKRFAVVLTVLSIVFVGIVAISFSVGMSRITELSLGSLQGTALIDIELPSETSMYMQATWGFGLGLYLVFFASVIAIATGIIDLFIAHQKKKKNQIC
jgi:hypothetical protein